MVISENKGLTLRNRVNRQFWREKGAILETMWFKMPQSYNNAVEYEKP